MDIKCTPVYYHEDEAIYYITSHIKNFKKVFSNTEYLDILLAVINQTQKIHKFSLYCYCLLLNHFHCVIQPRGKDTVSNIMHKIKGVSARRINLKINEQGHSLWESRFQARMITSIEQFQNIVDYIHYNPVKHKLVMRPEDWKWSSYRIFVKRGYYDVEW